MSLNYKIDNLDGVDEGFRGLYRKQEDGYVLDVDGVVPKSDYDEKSRLLDDERRISRGDDGRLYKDMFEGSQTANKAIRQERDAIRQELDGYRQLGTIDSWKTMQDELDGYKAKGKNLEDVEKANLTLRQNERSLQSQIGSLKSEKESLMREKAELEAYKNDAERKADLYDAEQTISKVVDGIKEANPRALKLHLMDRYKQGDLVRAANGELVEKDSAQGLKEYAVEKMESYGLYAGNRPGFANVNTPPPRGSGAKSGIERLAAMLHVES